MTTPGQIVKYHKGKATFEILVKPGSVSKWREGKLGIDNVLVTDVIFSKYSKAERAKSDALKTEFGTTDAMECIKVILEKGEVPVTSSERKEKVEKKRAEIVNYFHKYFIDPRSKLPHPVSRIENALDELKYHVDPDEPFERQVQEILKRLPEVLPVKRLEMDARLVIPHAFLGQCQGLVHRMATVRSEKYSGKGASFEVSILPGDYDSLSHELAKITKGDFQFDVDGADMTVKNEEPAAQKKRKGGKGRKR